MLVCCVADELIHSCGYLSPERGFVVLVKRTKQRVKARLRLIRGQLGISDEKLIPPDPTNDRPVHAGAPLLDHGVCAGPVQGPEWHAKFTG